MPQVSVESFHPHVFGFTKGVTAADSIITLLSHMNYLPTVKDFLNPEKEFELAGLHAILAALARKEVRMRLFAWLQDYLHHH